MAGTPSVDAVDTSQQDMTQQDSESQSSKSQSSSLQRILIKATGIVLTLVLVFWGTHAISQSDPYTSAVLELTGNASRGKEIFVTNCATCHGLEANGEVGPDLRSVSEHKSRSALIKQVISGKTPPMPQFQPNEKDMADLLSFLETL